MCALRHIPSSDVLAFVVDGSSEFDEVQWFIKWPETFGAAVLAAPAFATILKGGLKTGNLILAKSIGKEVCRLGIMGMHRSARCVAYKPNSLTDTSSCSAVVEVAFSHAFNSALSSLPEGAPVLLLVNKAGFCSCTLQGWHKI